MFEMCRLVSYKFVLGPRGHAIQPCRGQSYKGSTGRGESVAEEHFTIIVSCLPSSRPYYDVGGLY